MMLVAMLLLGAEPAIDPLAPSVAGKVQCYHPDPVRHRCRSIARYRRAADGHYDNEAVVLLTPEPLVVMTTITPVVAENGAVCGPIRREDVAAALIAVNGSALSAERLSAARTRIDAAMTPLFGHRICTRYVGAGVDLTAQASVDGVDHPEMTDIVRWVDESDGWSVGP